MTSPAPRAAPDLTLSEFRHAVSASFVPLRVDSPEGHAFRGRIRSAQTEGIHFTEVSAGPHRVERTPELIRRTRRQFYKLSLQLSGTGTLRQAGREAVLGPGDIALYETDRPYRLEFSGPFRVLVVMFPPRILALPPEVVSTLTAVRLGSESQLTALITPFLSGLADHFELLGGETGRRLAHNALDLVSTVFSHEWAPRRDAESPRHALLRQILEFISDNLGVAGLGPASIAEAHFMSTRYLHALFHERGTTVSSWIRTQRLEYARRDLVSPARAAEPIAAVAARWGFPDAAHFSRVFRAEFGQSPSGLRRLALNAPPPAPAPPG